MRTLQSKVRSSLLVAWMLTLDDDSRDGGLRSYLQDPDRWRGYDPSLFDGLSELLQSASKPSVSLIEGAELLPNASFYSEVVPDTPETRHAWWQGLLHAASGNEWVFLDPDNGIEVLSKPVGRKDSSKYVTWREIEGLWEAGCSVLIYQHFRREPRQKFAERMVSELRSRTGARFTHALGSPYVLFLLAAQERHEPHIRDAMSLLEQRWKGQVEPIRLANMPLQPTGFAGG